MQSAMAIDRRFDEEFRYPSLGYFCPRDNRIDCLQDGTDAGSQPKRVRVNSFPVSTQRGPFHIQDISLCRYCRILSPHPRAVNGEYPLQHSHMAASMVTQQLLY